MVRTTHAVQPRVAAMTKVLANDPDPLPVDEPAGNLDSRSEEELLEQVRAVHARGKTVVIVTHSDTVAALAERIVTIRDGRVAVG